MPGARQVNGFLSDTPMCRRDMRGMTKGVDYTCRAEPNGTGGTVWVTRFSDGSSITHWGGPAGKGYHNEIGEEC